MTEQTLVPVDSREARYRDRIYQQYVSAFKGHVPLVEAAEDFKQQVRILDYLLGPDVARVRPKKLLDVACGAGRILYWARERDITAAGFDVSEEQVTVAKAFGLNAEVASAADYLSRCDPDVDLITAFDIVEHFNRGEALEFLEQCRACLRPGGAIVLTTPNGAGIRPGPVVHGDLTHETIFSPATIRLALTLSGFEHIRVHEVVPVPLSIRGRIRWLLWRGLRLWPALLDLVEKGSAGGIYSRVMIVRARRAASEPALIDPSDVPW